MEETKFYYCYFKIIIKRIVFLAKCFLLIQVKIEN